MFRNGKMLGIWSHHGVPRNAATESAQRGMPDVRYICPPSSSLNGDILIVEGAIIKVEESLAESVLCCPFFSSAVAEFI